MPRDLRTSRSAAGNRAAVLEMADKPSSDRRRSRRPTLPFLAAAAFSVSRATCFLSGHHAGSLRTSSQGASHVVGSRASVARAGATSSAHRGRLHSARFAVPEAQFTRTAQVVTELSPITKDDLLFNSVIFLACCVPFAYATYEFWRRIAFGQEFGTGEDSIVFATPEDEEAARKVLEAKRQEGSGEKKRRPVGKEGKVTIGMDPETNRGRQVMGPDALYAAYGLMVIAALSMVMAGNAMMPILTGQVAVI
mmetsp:Transcript_62997/g.136783  ORF Transcript_62997/g.136783 Transcript_62997/m.136783 type:complete len:251 (+) Transcript_62997:52-804(+)